jgi:hypothetical protein
MSGEMHQHFQYFIPEFVMNSSKNGRKFLPIAFSAAAIAMGTASSAQAALMISFNIQDSLNIFNSTITCVDNAACDTNAATGTIVLANGQIAIPGFVVNGSTHTSKKSSGAGGLNELTSGSSTVSFNSTNASTFALARVVVSDTDYVGPSTTFSTSGSGTFVGAAGSTILMNYLNDPANQQGAEDPDDRPGNLVDTFSFTSPDANQSFSHNGDGILGSPDGALYGMSLVFDFTLMSGGSLVSRGQAIEKPTDVPEPASMLLFGIALGGVGLISRRKSSAQAMVKKTN